MCTSRDYGVYFTTNPADYEIEKPISPCFTSRGVVSHIIYEGKRFAVRRYGLDDMTSVEFRRTREEIRRVKGEVRHPNILPYLHVFTVNEYEGEKGYLEYGPQIWVITPLCDRGSALDLLSFFPEGLPEKAISYIVQQVLKALVYIHRKGFIHRSVKASHVLLCSDGRVFLTGMRCCISYREAITREYGEFPTSVNTDPELSTICLDTGKSKIWRGSEVVHHYPGDDAAFLLPWMAPEMLEQSLEGYTTLSDIYSFGILCCELGNGEAPYEGLSLTMLLLEKLRGSSPYLLDCTTFSGCSQGLKDSGVGDSVTTPDGGQGASSTMVSVLAQEAVYRNRSLAPAFHDLVNLCLRRHPSERPTAAAILESHPFVQPAFRASGSSSSSSLLKYRGSSSSSFGNAVPEDLVKVFKAAGSLPGRGRNRDFDSGASPKFGSDSSPMEHQTPTTPVPETVWDFS